MSATAASPCRPGNRIPELHPSEPDREFEGIPKSRVPVPEPAYGCVEWFQYVDRPGVSPAAAQTFTRM